MKKLSLLILLFLQSHLLSCAYNQKTLKSNFKEVEKNGRGVLLTVDLETAGKIKRGKSCHLIINQNNQTYRVPLKEGVFNYALNLKPGKARLNEFSCGPFYYYKINEPGAIFSVSHGSLTYIGSLDFELQDNGKMLWGPNTKSLRLLRANIDEMELEGDVNIEPLKL